MTGIPMASDAIKKNNQLLEDIRVQKILLLHEEKVVYMGDFCMRFGKMKYFRAFFDNARVSVNFAKEENVKYVEGLLANHPHLESIGFLAWKDIDFESYDIVFCISFDEGRVMRFFQDRYGEQIAAGRFHTRIYSLSEIMLGPVDKSRQIFPLHTELIGSITRPQQGELYLSREEQAWGDGWLESKGMKPGERLFILLDSSTRKNKLVNIGVYFELLTFLAGQPDVRILVFDEKKAGKEAFYREWLGPIGAERLIFSQGLQLREDLCLIGSSYTRLIFGPCTGLLHCASAIFNHYQQQDRIDAARLPLMITYTGKYLPIENNADFWWSASPLVSCLLLQEKNGRTEMTELARLTAEEKKEDGKIACSEYTAAMFIHFIQEKIAIR